MPPAHTSAPRTTHVVLAATLSALVGAALAARPRQVVRAVTGDDDLPSAVVVTRVLGVRYLLQAGAVAVRPGSVLPRAPWVDVAHAASMAPLLALPRYRRVAGVSAAVALVVAAGTRWAGRGR